MRPCIALQNSASHLKSLAGNFGKHIPIVQNERTICLSSLRFSILLSSNNRQQISASDHYPD